jgi:hypothetical protein
MQRSVLRLFAAFLLALVVLPLSAVSATASSFTITGRVTGLSATGVLTPLTMVNIDVEDLSNGQDVQGTHSNDDGTYTLTLPSAGDYSVHVWCSYGAEDNNCNDFAGEYYENLPEPVGATPISVTDGTPSVVDFELDRLATVKGRVVDQAGSPVAGVQVRAWAAVYPDYEVDTTDANGNYTLNRVDPYADHVLMDDPAGVWNSAWVNGSIEPGPAVSTIDVVATRGTAWTTTGTPTVSGSAVVGSTLTANPGTWSPVPDDFTYQWKRVDSTGGVSEIWFANDQTYVPTDEDAGFQLEVTVSPVKAGYQRPTRTSAATATVLKPFSAAPTPTITGTKAVGYTLTATTGTWSPTADSFAYQWYRAGVAISGATASTYKLTSYDKGKAITVRVTARKAGYLSTSQTSAATSAILGVYSTAPTPTISGTKSVGYTLTANTGTWSPTPTSFKYQWYRGSSAISGATYRTYKLTSYDKGQVVKVKVTPVLTGYYSPGKYSAGYTIS